MQHQLMVMNALLGYDRAWSWYLRGQSDGTTNVETYNILIKRLEVLKLKDKNYDSINGSDNCD